MLGVCVCAVPAMCGDLLQQVVCHAASYVLRQAACAVDHVVASCVGAICKLRAGACGVADVHGAGSA